MEGRVFVVTGATRGLGRATVQALVAEGARVIASAREPARLAQLQDEYGERVRVLAADNADPRTATRLVATAIDAYSRVDGLLISVGGPPQQSAMTVTDEQWVESFETLFLGAARLAREVAARLEPGGVIAMILSSSVRTPIRGLAISNALRPALAGLAKTLANELGPRGIRVVGLVPGRIETARTQEMDANDSSARGRSMESIPLRRLGQPEEFARVAAFMLSPAASYVTGSVVLIDGGMISAL